MLEQVEQVGSGTHAIGCVVELRGCSSKGEVDLRGHEQDPERGGEADVPAEEPQTEGEGHDGRGQGAQQLEGERGEQGDAQRPHGQAPEVLAGALEDLDLRLGSIERAERAHATSHVGEVAGQSCRRTPGGAHPPGGLHAEEHHEDREDEHGNPDDQRAPWIDPGDPAEHHDGGRHRQHEGGEVAGQVEAKGIKPAGH